VVGLLDLVWWDSGGAGSGRCGSQVGWGVTLGVQTIILGPGSWVSSTRNGGHAEIKFRTRKQYIH